MTRTVFYAGDPGQQLFGWHHVLTPEAVRGSVVICPSLGLEAEYSHTAIRILAEKLEAAGYAALRFDYVGTGDSEDPPGETDEVANWIGSIATAVGYARHLHDAPVTLVGIRVGAALAVMAARTSEVDQLVLWDPCSGSSFLRRQRALRMLVFGAPPAGDGSVDLPGLILSARTGKDLSRLVAPVGDVPAKRVLVLTRPGREGDAGLQAASGDHARPGTADRRTLVGQVQLLDVNPVLSRVSDADLDEIVGWIGGDARSEDPRPDPATPILSTARDGVGIVERPTFFGTRRIFGIIAEPSDPAARGSRPGIVFLNSGRFRHTGPGRVWVELSRKWAGHGFRTLRIDLSGLGDSGDGGETDLEGYPDTALDDMLDAAALVSPADPSNTVFVGVCSGGYHSLLAGLALGCRGVCAINPGKLPGARQTSHHFWWARSKAASSVTAGSSSVIFSLKARTKTLGVSLVDFARPISTKLPSSAWWLINRLTQRLVPAKVSERLVQSGTDVLIITETGLAQFMRRGERIRVRRMERSGAFSLVSVEGLDHDLFSGPARLQVIDGLTSHLMATFGPRGGAVGPPEPLDPSDPSDPSDPHPDRRPYAAVDPAT